MDPATAFGVAVGAIQLADVGIQIVRTCHEILENRSGLSLQHSLYDEHARQLETHVSRLSNRLKTAASLGAANTEDRQVIYAAAECETAATELQDRIAQIQLIGTKSTIKAFGKAIKELQERKKVAALEKRLERSKSFLDTTLLTNIRQRIDVADSKQNEILLQIDLSTATQTQHLQKLSHDLLKDLQNLTVGEGSQTRDFIAKLHDEDRKRQRVETLLNSLYFPSMMTRADTIEDSFESTFGWIFDESEDAMRPWNNFAEWLRMPIENINSTASSIFWIEGKPGSGKSTLMNFIANNPALEQNLAQWTSPLPGSELLMVRHYFWKSGSQEQRSIAGLLRSLSWQILKRHPEHSNLALAHGDVMPVWTEKSLRSQFRALMERVASATPPIACCFIIDGLDECEGNPEHLLRLVRELASFERTKCCVSSRPESAVVEALSPCKKLKLHDLTANDMRDFVRGNLVANPHMDQLLEDDRAKTNRLITFASEKADGVFLWAKLVVDDLVRGLGAKDTIDMLFGRLDAASESLDGLFAQLLARVHTVHHQKVAWYLAYVLAFQDVKETPWRAGTLSLVNFLLLENDDTRLSGLLFDGEEMTEGHEHTVAKLYHEFKALKHHILARCAGLLTVDEEPCTIDTEGISCCKKYRRTWLVSQLFSHYHSGCSVRVVHRSASDFLRQGDAAQSFMQRSDVTKYEAHVALAQMALRFPMYFLGSELMFPQPPKHGVEIFSLVSMSTSQVNAASWIRPASLEDMFGRIFSMHPAVHYFYCAVQMVLQNVYIPSTRCLVDPDYYQLMKLIWRGESVDAVATGLAPYLHGPSIDCSASPVLDSNTNGIISQCPKSHGIIMALLYNIKWTSLDESGGAVSSVALCKYLVSQCWDVNGRLDLGVRNTPWKAFLVHTMYFVLSACTSLKDALRHQGSWYAEKSALLADTLECFVTNGADLEAEIEWSTYRLPTSRRIWCLQCPLPARCIIRMFEQICLADIRPRKISATLGEEKFPHVEQFQLASPLVDHISKAVTEFSNENFHYQVLNRIKFPDTSEERSSRLTSSG